MLLLDKVKLYSGRPLTTDKELAVSNEIIREGTEQRNAQLAESAMRQESLTERVSADPAADLVKETGSTFSFVASSKKTKETLKSEFKEISRSESIEWRKFRESSYRSARTINGDYRRAVGKLLAVESEALEVLTANRQARLKETTEALKRTYDNAMKVLAARRKAIIGDLAGLTLDSQFKRIDLSFLTMTVRQGKNQGKPLFAVFTLKDPLFKLMCTVRRFNEKRIYRTEVQPESLPKELLQVHIEHLEAAARDYKGFVSYIEFEFCWKATFSGAIPDEVRSKIKKAKRQFDEIFIIAEAPEWEEEARITIPIRTGDPLVVGMKNGHFWLIDTFDTTPAEAYAAREFTT